MNKTSAFPAGMSAVIPHLICHDAPAAIDFYRRAFGAEEMFRLPAPDGRLMHAQIRIGGAAVMLVDAYPERGCQAPDPQRNSPVTLHLYVADTDATMAQAVAAGATVTMPAADMFWGDRYGRLRDPFGHEWSVATHVRDLSAEEILAAAQQACCPG